MALGARLEFRQSQNLVMTPQLMQSIKLLQMSNIELSEFVDSEIESNPLLERDEQEPGSPDDRRDDNAGSLETDIAGGSDEWTQDSLEISNPTIAEKLDAGLDQVFPDDPGRSESYSTSQSQNTRDNWQPSGSQQISGGQVGEIEAYVASEVTLRQQLSGQLAVAGLDSGDAIIASALLDRVDEDGYIRSDLEGVATRLGVDFDALENVITIMQGMEPSGICARSLEECLSIQLRERDRLDPAMAALIDNLDLLAKRDFSNLEKICQVDREDLVDMMHEIQALDPKPGQRFEHSPVQAVAPDVFVTEATDGSWHLELNYDTLPRVLVDRNYFSTVSSTLVDGKEKAFLVDCLQNANWLTKSLDQRAQTILKVSTEIVAQQDGFLVHGIRHLRPLNLKAVADAIKMHESTVSRVTSNKYMMTPRGLFELKYFFTAAISASDGGEALSSAAVKDQIKVMIEAETVDAVLSDDTIVSKLNEEGVEIARRTIAKYRDAMNIPSSVQRRREKRALAAVEKTLT